FKAETATNRSSTGLTQTRSANGTRSLNLEGRYQHVHFAVPDGTGGDAGGGPDELAPPPPPTRGGARRLDRLVPPPPGPAPLAGAALAKGQIVIITGDPPGQGSNDPTPAVPIGGNTGTTLGAQRLQVFETAASIWEATLHPKLDIRVLATFEPLGTNVLGSAGQDFLHH